jgi:hypothetical protein
MTPRSVRPAGLAFAEIVRLIYQSRRRLNAGAAITHYNSQSSVSAGGASMIQISYISQAAEPMSSEDLLSLLMQCRRNNMARDVTGMLLFANGTFLQVVEGDDRVVDDLVAVIEKDPRHTSVQLLGRRAIEARQYADWSMGFERVTSESFKTIEGLRDFSEKDFNFATLASSQAIVQGLMEHYRVSHWDPLVREIDAKDKVIEHLRVALVQSRGRVEVASLVLESVIAAANAGGVKADHLRMCESALALLRPKS